MCLLDLPAVRSAWHHRSGCLAAAFPTPCMPALRACCPQVLQLQQAILCGDWAAATKHIGRLDLQGRPQALQVRQQLLLQQQQTCGRVGTIPLLRNPLPLQTGRYYSALFARRWLAPLARSHTPLPSPAGSQVYHSRASLPGDSAGRRLCGGADLPAGAAGAAGRRPRAAAPAGGLPDGRRGRRCCCCGGC